MTWTMGPHTLLEARAGGMASTEFMDPHAPSTRSGPSPHYDYATGFFSGNVDLASESGGTRQTVFVTLAQDVARAIKGSHHFKFGVEFERTHSTDNEETPGGIFYMDRAGLPYQAYLGGATSSRSDASRATAYLQDEWTLTDHLTVSVGARASANRGRVPSGGTVFSTTPVSPRIGIAWDLGANHRTVLRAHVGRYFDPIFNSSIGQADTSPQEPLIWAKVVAPGVFQEIARYSPVTNFAIDPSIRHSYVDQFVIGIERQLAVDVCLQAQAVWRNYPLFMGIVDTGTVWAPYSALDTGPDGLNGTADDGGTLTVFQKTNPGRETYLLTNPANAHRRYTAFQAIGRKRYSHRWQLQASYTWSRAMGTVTNHWHANAAMYDLGGVNVGTFINPNVQINAYGHAPFDFTHEVKILGSYSVPLWGGVMVSGVYRAHTGYAWSRLAFVFPSRPGAARGIRMEPRGTRRTPAVSNLDLRIEKTLRIRSKVLGLFVDAFNLGNQGVPNAETVKPVVEQSGQSFGQPLAWVDPRSVRVGLRFSF